ncbi:hypothetical protein [Nitrosomonas sp. Nm58]|uniref:hypothetical protein n=1 Tax=Nitrosomonas sp. Nm58 TaxID=200126 RepID=UPI0015A513F2|nr:hypothetical protein [Nitrosomonas sp. Nm58]
MVLSGNATATPKSNTPAKPGVFDFFVNLIAGLVAYAFREKKPLLNIRLSQALPVVLM